MDKELNQTCPDPDSLFSPEKPGPLGQVRDIWFYLGVLCLKSQIPSTKFQIKFKFQVSNSKQGLKLFFYSFVCYLFFRSLEFICYLYFVIWDFPFWSLLFV
jgi:hypothetical protein